MNHNCYGEVNSSLLRKGKSLWLCTYCPSRSEMALHSKSNLLSANTKNVRKEGFDQSEVVTGSGCGSSLRVDTFFPVFMQAVSSSNT